MGASTAVVENGSAFGKEVSIGGVGVIFRRWQGGGVGSCTENGAGTGDAVEAIVAEGFYTLRDEIGAGGEVAIGGPIAAFVL